MTQHVNSCGGTERSTGRAWLEWSCLIAAGIVLIGMRLHAFDLPLENDECNYAYIGARLLEGERLYVDLWDHQPPGVFVLFASVIALFGDEPEVFRWMTTVFSLASLALVFLILRRVGGRAAAVSGAILFALVSSDPGTAGEGCNREIFMNTLILAAWYAALRWRQGGEIGWMVGSGCALGVASIIKTVVAVHWLLLAAWVVVSCVLDGDRKSLQEGDVGTPRAAAKHCVRDLVAFGAGPAVLWVGTGVYFALTARWSEFVDAVFFFNLSYSGASDGLLFRFLLFFSPPRHPFVFASALPLWIGAGIASIWLLGGAVMRRRSYAGLVLLLVISAYVSACLPARFWPHYYYLLVPAAVIAVSAAAGQIALYVRHRFTEAGVAGDTFAIALLVVVPGAALVSAYRHYISQPLFGLTVHRYNSRDFWGRAQGWNVARVTEPGDKIFVFGNDAEIYYYSGRRCASRFTMITGLQAAYAGAERRRETLLAELRADPPRLIVVLFDEPPFDAWKAFLDEHYGQPIGWDFHDRTGEPIMFVAARKDRPVVPINWDWDRSEVGGWFLGERRE